MLPAISVKWELTVFFSVVTIIFFIPSNYASRWLAVAQLYEITGLILYACFKASNLQKTYAMERKLWARCRHKTRTIKLNTNKLEIIKC